jgi:hypothetical protein
MIVDQGGRLSEYNLITEGLVSHVKVAQTFSLPPGILRTGISFLIRPEVKKFNSSYDFIGRFFRAGICLPIIPRPIKMTDAMEDSQTKRIEFEAPMADMAKTFINLPSTPINKREVLSNEEKGGDAYFQERIGTTQEVTKRTKSRE